MAERTPPKPPAEVCAVAGVSPEGKALLAEGMAAEPFLGALTAAGRHEDAVRFLAHSLPRREAVWWAWVCAKRTAGATPEPAVKASLDATEKWIAQPTDEHRRAAMAAAEKADLGTPAGCAGLAAFLSGGSLGPPEHPAVPPAEPLMGQAVAGSLMLAAVSREPEKAGERLKAFVAQGVEVAKRIKLWDTAATPSGAA
jgi:hypothetical protein